jgi:hypothetical protein
VRAEAHRALETARVASALGSPDLPGLCCLLGLSWADRYERELEPGHLDRAIAQIQQSLQLAPDHAGERDYLLACALRERAVLRREAAGNVFTLPSRADLNAAAHHARRALATIGTEDPLRVAVLTEAVVIAVTQLEESTAAVDMPALRAWAGQLRALHEQMDPAGTTAEAQAARALCARVLAAEVDREPPSG